MYSCPSPRLFCKAPSASHLRSPAPPRCSRALAPPSRPLAPPSRLFASQFARTSFPTKSSPTTPVDAPNRRSSIQHRRRRTRHVPAAASPSGASRRLRPRCCGFSSGPAGPARIWWSRVHSRDGTEFIDDLSNGKIKFLAEWFTETRNWWC